MPKQTYIAELAPVATPLPRNARLFVLLEAESDSEAIDTVNSLGIIRHDKAMQCDLYERNGREIGRKRWSGLSKPPRSAPRLSVVA